MSPPLAYASLGSSTAPRRQWAVRLRRDDGAELVVSTNLSQARAEHLAEQLNGFLRAGLPDAPWSCGYCGAPISQLRTGRPRQWCSQRCREAAYRQRQTTTQGQ
jgi:hypothetical protein